MKASEKFEARLKELNLWDEWNTVGSCGRVAKFDDECNINILVHEGTGDAYSEIWRPSFEELRDTDEAFVSRCWDLVKETEDGEFARDLALWLMKKTNKDCPLHPTDAYFLSDIDSYYHDFTDDDDADNEDEREEAEYQSFIERTAEFMAWTNATLDFIRKSLYGAIRTELERGHNIPHNYDIANGQDYFLDYSFCYVEDQQIKLCDNGRIAVVCSEVNADTGKKFDEFEIPLESLSVEQVSLLYESMK